MLIFPTSVRIYLSTQPTDMRKGFDSLSALVRQQGFDVFSGHLFVFVSRKKNRIKILSWSNGGFILAYKRLERGRFKMPQVSASEKTVRLEASQLAMLLDGIDYSHIRRPRLWHPPSEKK